MDEGKTLSLVKTRTKFYQRKLNALEPEKQAVTPGHLTFSRPIGDAQKLPNPHAISRRTTASQQGREPNGESASPFH